MGLKKLFNKIKKEKEVIQGKEKKDKIFSSLKNFENEEDAKRAFTRSKSKLFDLNSWSSLPGITSSFKLYSANGDIKLAPKPEKGDFILIELPGPLPENWVAVLSVEEKEDFAEFVVSPSPNPKAVGKEAEEIQHFFIDEATSTFRVRREGDSIFGYEIGKNEIINNNGDKAAHREWINTLIAEGGWAGFQKIQWQKLTDYLVHEIEISEA